MFGAALAPRPCFAGIITVDFTGYYSSGFAPGSGGGPGPGDGGGGGNGGGGGGGGSVFDLTPFQGNLTGSFTFDSNAPGTPTTSGGVSYGFLSLSGSVAGGSSGYSFSNDGANSDDQIYVYHSLGNGDGLQLVADGAGSSSVGSFNLSQALIDLDAPYNTVFTSMALPTVLPNPSSFNYQHTLQLSFTNSEYQTAQITYTLTSLSSSESGSDSSAPEPSTFALVFAAVAILPFARRRKRAGELPRSAGEVS